MLGLGVGLCGQRPGLWSPVLLTGLAAGFWPGGYRPEP